MGTLGSHSDVGKMLFTAVRGSFLRDTAYFLVSASGLSTWLGLPAA